MKIVARPVDMIAVFYEGKRPMPWRFRYLDPGGELVTVQVDRVISTEDRRIAGISTYNYCCQSRIRSEERRYELKYFLKDARWELYKI
ncbi:MAG: hypothetical protein ACOYJJ_01830 [Anaerovoracaceae bacterium]